MKEQLKAIWEAVKLLPYKWQWALLMFACMLLFSWWDELVVWGVGIGWKWQIIPVYYFFEYGILIPLTIWLGVKTYRKLEVAFDIRQLAKQSIMNSLPMLIWRGLKRLIRKKRPKVISIGFSVPDNIFTQEEVFQVLGYPQRFWRVFKEGGIDKRHLWVEPNKAKKLSWQQQQEAYMEGALALSLAAVRNCLDGRSVEDIGCVVFSSCTGFAPGPVIPHLLARELGLATDTFFTNIGAMGCESGFPGLKRAYDFTVTTGKPSLVIACELCSCTYYPEPDGKTDPENHFELLRSNAIFADAASCALVGFDDDPRHPSIIDMETYTNIDFINELGYTWRDGRLRVLLSRRVPELAPLVVKPAVDAVLQRQGLSIDDIRWWVIHAAGNTVLDNIRDALGIAEEKVTLSRETLRRFGNTSSTSVGITGKRLMAEDIHHGDYAAVLSIGPGMTGGCSLLRFGGC